MHAEAKRVLIDTYIQAYNNFDIEKMLSVVHVEIEFANMENGEVNASASGIDDFRRMAEQSKNLFESRNQRITRFFEKENMAVIDVDYEAVLAANLAIGIETAEKLRLKGLSEFVFKDGKICKITDITL